MRDGHASFDRRSREKKAEKIRAIVETERELRSSVVLEIGVGSGIIAARLAEAVGQTGEVWGVDVRDSRVVTEGFRFALVRDTLLPFADSFFDVVVSNHVLEHVGRRPEQLAHLQEVARVLKDDGVAYLATPNRWAPLEPHYRLPLLSWLPARVRSHYVRLVRRGREYDCDPRGWADLRDLCSAAGLDVSDRTLDAIRLTVEIEGAPAPVRRLARADERVLRMFMPIVPTHVAILRRSDTARRG